MNNILDSIINNPVPSSKLAPSHKLKNMNEVVVWILGNKNDAVEACVSLILNPYHMIDELRDETSQLLTKELKKLYNSYYKSSKMVNSELINTYKNALVALKKHRISKGGSDFEKAYHKLKESEIAMRKDHEINPTLKMVENACSAMFLNIARAYNVQMITRESDLKLLKGAWENSLTYKPEINFDSYFDSNEIPKLHEKIIYSRSMYSDVKNSVEYYLKHMKSYWKADDKIIAKSGTLYRRTYN
jgi:hypothetical protein